jgi:exodeoxyribonuclease V alpha subunit
MNLSTEQMEAGDLCADRKAKLVGVTGEAGTGKTTLMKYVVENLDGDTLLVAPTGRAAKRIQEATSYPARTIHRALRWSVPDDDDEHGLPAYDAFNKMPYDNILCDEASMVSEDIYRAIIDAMHSRAVIRFFGDSNQLPPVEGKSPFLRILEKFPSFKLTQNFRSHDGIVTAARQIIRGRVPEINDQFNMFNPGQNFNMLAILDEYTDDSYRGLNGQVIIPTRVGKYGTERVNRFMQQKHNGDGPMIEIHIKDRYTDEVEERRFRVGDKIIWTKNDYKLNLFNGQIGWISDFDLETGDILANFDGKDKIIPPHLESYDPQGRAIFQYDPRKVIELAYAITTHKAQGSEFNKVLLILNKSYVLNRANFYTAVTRARKSCNVVLGSGALATAIRK